MLQAIFPDVDLEKCFYIVCIVLTAAVLLDYVFELLAVATLSLQARKST
jgi:hypothetical protein